MQGATIAAALRKRREKAKKEHDEKIDALINEKSSQVLARIEKIDDILVDSEESKLFGLNSGQSNHANVDAATLVKQVEGLIAVVEEKIDRSSNYRKLMGTSIFFIIFLIILFMQREVTQSYIVESSILNALVTTAGLNQLGSGGYFNSGSGATGQLASGSEFFDWIEKVSSNIFTDSTCGDGVCDSGEYPGFGRFGCVSDCGRFKNVTVITIDLKKYVKTELPTTFQTSTTAQDLPDPGYRYNIWSTTMGAYLFATDQKNETVKVEVPDGELRLELYQTKSVDTLVESSTVTDFYKVTETTLPERKSDVSDYFYGDSLEALKLGASLSSTIYNYCYNTAAALTDTYCLSIGGADTVFTTMKSYGLAGEVTYQDGRSEKTLATVSFCGPMSNGTEGATDANRIILRTAETTCPSVPAARRNEGSNGLTTSSPAGGRLGAAQRRLMTSSTPGSGGPKDVKANGLAARKVQHVAGGGARRQEAPEVTIEWTTTGGDISSGIAYSKNYNIYTSVGGDSGYFPFWGYFTVNGGGKPTDKIIVTTDGSTPECDENDGSATTGVVWPRGKKSTDVSGSNPVGEETFPWMSGSGYTITTDTASGVKYYENSGSTFTVIAGLCQQEFGFWYIDDTQIVESSQTFQPAPTFEIQVSVPYSGTMNGVVEGNMMADAKTAVKELLELDGSGKFGNKRIVDGVVTYKGGQGGCTGGGNSQMQCYNGTVDTTKQFARTKFRVLADSNRQLTEWKVRAVNLATFSSEFSALYAGQSPGNVGATVELGVVSVPTDQRFMSGFGGACTTHYDCKSAHFCSTFDVLDQVAPTCVPCNSCMFSENSVDGKCPQDLCPGSGGYAPCNSGFKLQELNQQNTCKTRHTFSVWRFTSQTQNAATGQMERVAPKVLPDPVPVARMVTPFNRLVGSIIITQRRKEARRCNASSRVSRNTYIDSFTDAASVTCPGETISNETYGYDPSFMPSSTLYNGRLLAADWYKTSERHLSVTTLLNGSATTSPSFPKGFFAHGYAQSLPNNPQNSSSSSKVTHVGQENLFKLYLDEGMTRSDALRAVKFANDGRFIDELTDRIWVDVNTYNADLDIFAQAKFWFTFGNGGTIPWDYSLQSVSVNLQSARAYEGLWRALQIVFVTMLCLNCMLEIQEILVEVRKFQIWGYITNPYNWIDWGSFIMLWATAISWLVYETQRGLFSMNSKYSVLATEGADARIFLPNEEQEVAFLEFSDRISSLSNAMDTYSTFSGIAVILMVFRILKSLNFQERMGLVTRTLEAAMSDLMHFFGLFGIVFAGYTFVGNLLFGHQFAGMSTVSSTALTLVIFLLSLDATQFYPSMAHAANDVAFHLFLWSYLIVAFFILLNIFLAILVDAYASVKQETVESTGLTEELKNVARHGIKRRFMPSSKFVSDQKLLSILEGMRDELQGNAAIAGEVKRSMAHRNAVLLPGGIELDRVGMAKFALKAVQKGKQNQVADAMAENVKSMSDSPEGQQMLSNQDVVVDLMSRYGTDVHAKIEQHNSEVRELVEMENLKRQLCMFTAQGRMLREQARVIEMMELIAHGSLPREQIEIFEKEQAVLEAEVEEMQNQGLELMIGRLEMTAIRALDLPKVDLFRGCDPYVVAYLDSSDRDEIYKSDPVRGNKNPEFNLKYDWEIKNSTKWLVVTVMDRDQITKDDIIGCVSINVRDLGWGEESTKEYPLENPAMMHKLKTARIELRVKKTELGLEGGAETSAASAEAVSPAAVRSSPQLDAGTNKAQGEGDSLPSFTPKSGAGGAASDPLEFGKPNGAGVDEAEIA